MKHKLSLTRLLFANQQRRSFSTLPSKQTSLYIWTDMPRLGPKATEIKQQFAIPKGIPLKVEAFDKLDVKKIFIGIRHSAAITGDGSLYTFGSGNWGVLGHGNEKDVRFDHPQQVEYFAKRNLKVVDIALGEYHSVVLTDDGSVYTWGYAGKTGLFNWMYTQEVGALGHGDKKHTFTPKKVEYFDKKGINIVKVLAGLYHTSALTADGDLYTWGRGLYGVLGNASNQYALTPELNEEIKSLKVDEGKTIVKMDSADEYSGALMNDGSLYVWGKNDRGQMGVGSGIGIDMVESENVPVAVNVVDPDTNTLVKVKDFHTGQNTMLIRDENDNIYKTGLKLDYTPKKLQFFDEFDKKAVSLMTCGRKHYALVNDHNQMMVWGRVFKEKPIKESEGFNLYFTDSLFEGGKLKDLQMKYGIFGALVEHEAK